MPGGPLTHCTLPSGRRSRSRRGPERRRHPRGAALHARAGHLPSASLPASRAQHLSPDPDGSVSKGPGTDGERPSGRAPGGGIMSAARSEKTQNSGNQGRVPAEGSGPSRGRKTLATTTGSFAVERLGADHRPGAGGRRRRQRDPDATPGRAERGPVRARRRRRRRVRGYLGQQSPCSGGVRACGVAGAVVAERAALGVARRAHTSQRNRLSRRDIT